jgi:hypothetical protein
VWLTSTALVALIVSTIIYGWQRSYEHKHILLKEKRDLYLNIIRQVELMLFDLVNGKMDDDGYIPAHQNSREASVQLSMLKIYEAAGVFDAYRAVIAQFAIEAKRGVRPGLTHEELLEDIRMQRERLEEEMRIDLQDTVRAFDWFRKKRFRFKPYGPS